MTADALYAALIIGYIIIWSIMSLYMFVDFKIYLKVLFIGLAALTCLFIPFLLT